MAYMLVNKDTGFSLRNLPSAKFNDGTQKKTTLWTFAGLDRAANTKALELLAAKGFTNLEFVEITAETEGAVDEAADKAAVKKGSKQPRTKAEAEQLAMELGLYEDPDTDYLFKELNSYCKTCQKVCKQSHAAVIYSCGQYQKVAA
jgi:hypothetical protein